MTTGVKLAERFRFHGLSICSRSSVSTVLREESALGGLSGDVEVLRPSAESTQSRKKGERVVADLETGRGSSVLRRCLYRSQLLADHRRNNMLTVSNCLTIPSTDCFRATLDACWREGFNGEGVNDKCSVLLLASEA